ncbi:MAG: hypothetical protein PHU03_00250 [Syntrophales bacterium]|nr:hypothetical protein [Syntrophales bacterium]
MDTVEEPRVNRDLIPSLYYDTLILWSAQHKPRLATVLRSAGAANILELIAIGIMLTFVLAVYGRWKSLPGAAKVPVFYACFMAGYTQMTVTVLLILAFQVFYGYVYYKIAFLVTAYMIGLMLGSRYVSRHLNDIVNYRRALALIQFLLALYTMSMWGAISLIHGLPPQSWARPLWELCFPLLLAFFGILGGIHFPLSGALYAGRKNKTGEAAGLIYGMDLTGSALGAFLAGMLLLPSLGIARTLVLMTFFNLVATGWLMLWECPHRNGRYSQR